MSFQGLDLNLLVSLDVLLSEKSVTRAAERVHVTQPAMSASLQKLRLYLSDPLLERVGRQLELTPRARELAGPVKELLLRIGTVLNAQQVFDPKTAKRTFRIAMSGYTAELLGVPLIRYITENAPGISIQIDDLAKDSMLRVNEGELDFCITVVERPLLNESHSSEILSTRHLFSDKFVLVAAQGNTAVDTRMTYDSLCALPYVEVRFSNNFMSVPDLVLESQYQRPRARAWMPTSQNALAAVSKSMAVAIVPSRLFEIHRGNLQLKCVEPPLHLPVINEICFWHPRNDTDSGHNWFGSTLRTLAAELNGEQAT